MAKRKLKKQIKTKIKIFTLIALIILLIVCGVESLRYYFVSNEKLEPIDQKKQYYNISDFGFAREISDTDYNNNGKDDYKDILEGEKQYAKLNPKYKSEYYDGGYPPVEKEGVCTDLIWYALKNAGYNLKDMIDKDIKQTRKQKKKVYDIDVVDQNIDFRRVSMQETFFQRYAQILDTDMYSIGQFMPGDIVTFDYSEHIAMISDKYTKDAVPYLIQNRDGNQKNKEENRLEKTKMEITGHYRLKYTKKLEKLIKS